MQKQFYCLSEESSHPLIYVFDYDYAIVPRTEELNKILDA
jgi:hypothetical protein